MSRILVAGASSGIGCALVFALIEDGHDVLPTSRRPAGRADSGHYTQCDVRDEDQVQRLYARIWDGRGALDALIVTAGTFGAIDHIDFTESSAWADAWRTNVLGLYHLAKHGIPLLTRGDRPRLLTFAGGGDRAFPCYSAYATSKAAVVRLTECLAAELAPIIAVNAVAPGMVDTPIHNQTLQAGPLKAGLQYRKTLDLRGGQGASLDRVVACVRWLLSTDADGITGRTIAANFDPWWSSAFAAQLLADPDLCTLRRQGPRPVLDMAPDDEAYPG